MKIKCVVDVEVNPAKRPERPRPAAGRPTDPPSPPGSDGDRPAMDPDAGTGELRSRPLVDSEAGTG